MNSIESDGGQRGIKRCQIKGNRSRCEGKQSLCIYRGVTYHIQTMPYSLFHCLVTDLLVEER